MATIILDFDDTLHDTQRLKDDIRKVLLSHDIKDNDILSSYQEARADLDYNFEKHIHVLSKTYKNIEVNKLLKGLNSLFSNNYVFNEIEETLKKLKSSHRLILLTSGEEEAQNKKIDNSNLRSYFDSIYITQENKINIINTLNLTGEIYFINDKISENEEIKKRFPKFIYLVSVSELLTQDL